MMPFSPITPGELNYLQSFYKADWLPILEAHHLLASTPIVSLEEARTLSEKIHTTMFGESERKGQLPHSRILKGILNNQPVYYVVVNRRRIPSPPGDAALAKGKSEIPSEKPASLPIDYAKSMVHPALNLNRRRVAAQKIPSSLKRQFNIANDPNRRKREKTLEANPLSPSRLSITLLPSYDKTHFHKYSTGGVPEMGMSTTCGYAQENIQDVCEAAVIELDQKGKLNKLHFPFYALFSGHYFKKEGSLGKACAEAAAQFLPTLMQRELQKYWGSQLNADEKERIIYNAFKQAFVATSDAVKERVKSTQPCGTTATAAFLCENNLWVAWTGDSRAIVCRRDEPPSVMTWEHYPSAQMGKNQSIYNRGGAVEVAPEGVAQSIGSIPLARALGHPEIEAINNGTGEITPAPVNPRPTITRLEKLRHSIAVICSKGVWQALSTETVNAIVQEGFKKNSPCKEIAQEIIRQSSARGIKDNQTALVVYVKGPPLTRGSFQRLLTEPPPKKKKVKV